MSEQLLQIPNTIDDDDAFFNQEEDDDEEGGEDVDHCVNFKLLRLDGFDPSSSSNSDLHRTPCATCGRPVVVPPIAAANISSSNKRRSPDTNALPLLSKKPKKLFPLVNNPAASVPDLSGFSVISLPVGPEPRPDNSAHHVVNTLTQSVDSIASLRRCFSDPYNPPVSEGVPNVVVPQSPPESAKMVETATTPASKGSSSLPPLPPAALRRTVSDPSPSKSFSRSSGSNEIVAEDNFQQKLKRMKNIMKEMNHWMDEILPDQGTCQEEQDHQVIEHNVKDSIMGDSMNDGEEAVTVERIGECLNIHFRCPCSKGYQILLAKGTCYYKLM